VYEFLLVLWFLELFSPQKLLQYFLPIARPVSWIPELLLWVSAIMWLRGSAPKRGFPAFTRFMALFLFGTVVAYFHGQWGLARGIDRLMYQLYLLGLITLTICDSMGSHQSEDFADQRQPRPGSSIDRILAHGLR
jgi:hypothetical protein